MRKRLISLIYALDNFPFFTLLFDTTSDTTPLPWEKVGFYVRLARFVSLVSAGLDAHIDDHCLCFENQ